MATSIGIRLTESFTEFLCIQRSRGNTRVSSRLILPSIASTANADNTPSQQLPQVKSFLKKNKIRNGQVFVSVPRAEVVLREIELPMVVEENLEQVLSYEIDRYTPFSKDEAYFAFEITSRNPETNLIRLLFAAIEKPRLQAYVARLAQLGITPAAIEIIKKRRQIRKNLRIKNKKQF